MNLSRTWTLAAALLCLPLLLLCLGACSRAGAGAAEPPGGDLAVRHGTFEERYLLTGELAAARASWVTVPRTRNWQTQIRWMEEDGAEVRRGQKVLELEDAASGGDLEDRQLALVESENALARLRAEAAAAIAEAEFAVERQQATLDKARIQAEVPRELLSGREHQDRQLALRRAETELEKAEEKLLSTRRSRELEVQVQEIELAKARRELTEAEQGIEALILTAPADGVLVTQDHPWEERKLQVGDNIWVGMRVMQIPDLSSLGVEAVLYDVDEGRIRPGMRAVLTLDAFPEQRSRGRVLEVAPLAREVENRSLRRSFQVRLDLDESDPERMRPGMSVKVEIFTDPIEGALLAPRAALDLGAALDPGAEAARAYLAGGGSRPVRLGACNPSHCVVEEGLAEGERLAPRPHGAPEEAS